MPYSPEHKRHSRARILRAAHELFAAKGYEQVSIDQVMAAAGLTRGAFYAHFRSKSELYAKAILAAPGRSPFAKVETDEVDDWLQELLALYLGEDHLRQRLSPCPLAFFATDVANRDPRVRRVYTQVYRRFNDFIRERLQRRGQPVRDQVLAATALMIGGVAVARALDDEALRQRLLEACRRSVRQLLQEEQRVPTPVEEGAGGSSSL